MAQVMSPHPLHPDTPRPRNLWERQPQKDGKRENRGERAEAGASLTLRQNGGCLPAPLPAPGRYPSIIPVFSKIILIFPRNMLNFLLSPEGLSGLKKGGSSSPSTLGVLLSLPRIIPKFLQCYPKFFPGLSQFSPGFPKFSW